MVVLRRDDDDRVRAVHGLGERGILRGVAGLVGRDRQRREVDQLRLDAGTRLDLGQHDARGVLAHPPCALGAQEDGNRERSRRRRRGWPDVTRAPPRSSLRASGAGRRLRRRGRDPRAGRRVLLRARRDAPAEGRARHGGGVARLAEVAPEAREPEVVARRDAGAPLRLRVPGRRPRERPARGDPAAARDDHRVRPPARLLLHEPGDQPPRDRRRGRGRARARRLHDHRGRGRRQRQRPGERVGAGRPRVRQQSPRCSS